MPKYQKKTEPVFTHGDNKNLKPKDDDSLQTLLFIEQVVL
jgi:hypothetical protein